MCIPAMWTPPTPSDNCPGVVWTSNYSPGVILPEGQTTTIIYTATDASQNVGTYTFDIFIYEEPEAPDSVNTDRLYDNICVGQNITLTAHGYYLGYQGKVMWYLGGCGPANGGVYVGQGPTLTIAPQNSGTYFARVEALCDTTACASIDVQVTTGPPDKNFISVTGALPYAYVGQVFNMNTTYSGPASTAPAYWQYETNHANSYLVDGNPLGSNPASYITNNNSANVTVIQSWQNHHFWILGVNACGQSARSHIRFRGNVEEPGAISASSPTACPNACVTYTVPPLDGSTHFTWTITPSTAGVITSNNSDNSSVTVCYDANFAGTATLCVNGNTTFNLAGPQTCITVSNVTDAPGAISGNIAPCADGTTSYNYSIAPVTGATSYNWYLGGTLLTSTTGTTLSTTIPVGFTSGDLCVAAVSSCGVASAQSCLSLSAGVAANPGAISGLTEGVCGLTLSYSVANTGASNYQWSVSPASAGTVSSGNGSTNVDITFSGAHVGPITINMVATYACGTNATSLVVDGKPAAPAVTPGLICPGAFATYTAISANASSYNCAWTGANLATPSGNTLLVIWNNNPTGQSLTVSAANGCGTSASTTLTENCSSPRFIPGGLADLNVYPNPTSGLLTVEFNLEAANDLTLKITDVAGRTISEEALDAAAGINRHEVDLTEVRKGMYMLYLTNSEGQQEVRRVTVQ